MFLDLAKEVELKESKLKREIGRGGGNYCTGYDIHNYSFCGWESRRACAERGSDSGEITLQKNDPWSILINIIKCRWFFLFVYYGNLYL